MTLALAGSCAIAELSPRGFADFARDLYDLEALKNVDFEPLRLESSYDRTGANRDGMDRPRIRDNVYPIAELKGPGVVRRMFSARPWGRLQVFLDGSDAPIIDMPCEEFFSGRHAPFVRPLVGPMGGGNYSYFPIPFAKSLVIQTIADGPPEEGGFGLYYHVYYQLFPGGDAIRSLALPLSPAEEEERKRVLTAWREVGSDPMPPDPAQLRAVRNLSLAPGESATLLDINGPGVIDQLHIELSPRDPALLRSVLLRMQWDEEDSPGVDCPIGDFFGNAFDWIPYRALPMGLVNNRYYSYFRMPFGSRARLTIQNESERQTVGIDAELVHRSTGAWQQNVGYFHAKWRREETIAVNLQGKNLTGEYNYRFMHVGGQGRFVGMNLNVFNRQLDWWGEGDPMIFVDGETWPPAYHGTGTEDHFNDAWGFHKYIVAAGADPAALEQNVTPLSGVLLAGVAPPIHAFAGNAVFAFNLADSVPFRQRILGTIEHGAANDMTNDYSSTAYWYARPGGHDFFRMRPEKERETIPRSRWTDLREAAVRPLQAVLRRQLSEIAAEKPYRPTDDSNFSFRSSLARRLFMFGSVAGFPDSERERLHMRLRLVSSRPPEERRAELDKVLHELIALILPDGGGEFPGTPR
jgi:hypothetical protein